MGLGCGNQRRTDTKSAKERSSNGDLTGDRVNDVTSVTPVSLCRRFIPMRTVRHLVSAVAAIDR